PAWQTANGKAYLGLDIMRPSPTIPAFRIPVAIQAHSAFRVQRVSSILSRTNIRDGVNTLPEPHADENRYDTKHAANRTL
ncbi:hypothetical protein, partial [Edwardsiella tarda]|uniref:hypothetical protein n=1 Tax=Edwardsiella tarda TaxID=636 RepID=UPI001967C2AC